MRYEKPLYDKESVETVDIIMASNIEQDEENTNASASLGDLLDKLKNLGN